MKVVAKRTVLDRIMEDINKLRREDREVDYVVVTDEERRELHMDHRCDRYLGNSYRWCVSSMPMDATFKTWEFTRTVHPSQSSAQFRGRDHIRVTNHGETFCGFPLLVVPADFHPK